MEGKTYLGTACAFDDFMEIPNRYRVVSCNGRCFKIIASTVGLFAGACAGTLAAEELPLPPSPGVQTPPRQAVGDTPLPPPKPEPGQALHAYLENAFTPYQPLYFLVDPEPLNAKIQLSFAVMLIGRAVKPEGSDDVRNGLYFGYTQISFWDLNAESKPFFDNNYHPEVWWHQGGLPSKWLGVDNLAVEAGAGHESNGQSGDLSRSVNSLMVRPQMRWDLPDDWQIHLTPKLKYPVGDLSENSDITTYRGIFDLTFDAARYSGIKCAVTTYVGTGLNRGAFQIDLSYPLTDVTRGWINCFIYAQWFDGWGESMRAYDERSNRVLLGIAFIR